MHGTHKREVCVRDLAPGMVVELPGGESGKISAITVMDGTNGERPALVSSPGHKTATAIRIEFDGEAPIIAHPSAIVLVR